MHNAEIYKKYAVLYVDDESQALKYFQKAFAKEFNILSASSVEEAWKIVESNSSRLAIVITDQRMPSQTGTELLARIRKEYPDTIRILTTAYSDLEAAVDAVNSGSIYKYIVKPWDISDLKVTLMRALEFFDIRQQRDALLNEKLSVLQSMIVSDRVRSLAAFATGISHHVRNSLAALGLYLESARELVESQPGHQMEPIADELSELWEGADRATQDILEMVHRVIQSTREPNVHFDDNVSIEEIIQNAWRDIAAENGAKLEVSVEPANQKVPLLKCDQSMMHQLFSLLFRFLGQQAGKENRVSLIVESNAKNSESGGVSIKVRSGSAPWSDQVLATLFSPFAIDQNEPSQPGVDLLAAFFIVYHHGGRILVHKSPPEGPGFEIHLPRVPVTVDVPKFEMSVLAKLSMLDPMWARLKRLM